ncbi:MAG: hypothetical protein AAGF07_03455 [Patescibacteria group bacterium]
MSIPHLSTLQNISELEQKISSLEQEVVRLQDKLESTKKHYESAKKSEYTRLLGMYTQENTLLKIQTEILDLRESEKTLKQQVSKVIVDCLNGFFENGGLRQLVEKIIHKEQTHKREVKVFFGQNMEDKVKDINVPQEKVSSEDTLRLESEDKTYILDKDILSSSLYEKLFIKLLSN